MYRPLMHASITSQPKGTGCEGTGRARAVHLIIGWNCCLSAILIQNCLACMQISYEYKMQTVILRGVHMSQQDLHGCSKTLKIMQSIVLVWICSVHNETMKHCMWDIYYCKIPV